MNIRDDMEIRAVSAPWNGGVDLLVRQRLSRETLVGELKMVQVDQGEIINPTVAISMDSAQCLMDDLWNAGLRPTEGTGSAGALRAVEKHTDDLRKIVFKTLNIE